MKLGVCYYPEHWPDTIWAEDARRMREMGLAWVRIGEFAWSRIEPEPGRYDWTWLDRAIAALADAGLHIVLCTPTATPPKWLVDSDPTMLAVDARGRPRRFGSRRHYCFSSRSYRAACARIVTALAERYGTHPAVQAWQTDNEFGCHDTTISYSPAAAQAFRQWLAGRYTDIAALNRAWGNVFWSMEYRSFDEIDPPNLTVTEANPSHRLDYNRFASEEVAQFNRLQTDILRRHAPGRPIAHNFMGFTTSFDHFDVAGDLDIAAWDSYPLGFLDQSWFGAEEKTRYLRQGHPDIAAFHHDLYRGCGRGRWWVMEQQPGPVNWAPYNPAPLPGMVRAWSWEAFAHGAEVVSYFRWRQVPFAQEQMHAALHLPDSSDAAAAAEVRQVAQEIADLDPLPPCGQAPVALIVSYESAWMTGIQPQGRDFHWLKFALALYTAARELGLDVDLVPAGAALDGYRLILVPPLLHAGEDFLASLRGLDGEVLLGPRTGSKTPDFQIPAALPPGALQDLLPLQVVSVESLRPGIAPRVHLGQETFSTHTWRETVRTALTPLATFEDGAGAWYAAGSVNYLACWPDSPLLTRIVSALALRAGLKAQTLPEGVRMRRRGGLVFAINFSTETRTAPAPEDAQFVLGNRHLPPAGVAAWREG